MAAAASADWVSCHRADQGDKGAIEALCSLDDNKTAEISKTHNNDNNNNNNNIGALRTTIASSGGGNFLLVLGSEGRVKFLHHQGFATTTHLGGATILGFIQSDFSSSPFKAISSPAEAVPPIDQGRVTTRGKDAAPAARPTLLPFLELRVRTNLWPHLAKSTP